MLACIACCSAYRIALYFSHLEISKQLSHVPFELDYLEVFEALCDQLFKLYDSMMHEECYR